MSIRKAKPSVPANDLRHLHFAWSVPGNGFEWKEAADFSNGGAAKPCLTFREPNANFRRHSGQDWNLREESALFRRFADIQPTREGLRAFADSFGLLGVSVLDVQYSAPPSSHVRIAGDSDPSPKVGEFEDQLILEHHALREAVRLWEALRDRNVPVLSRSIDWKILKAATPVKAVFYTRPKSDREEDPLCFPIAEEGSVLFESFKFPDLVSPGWHALGNIINRQLRRYATRAQLHWESFSATHPRVKFVPQNLISALWLQLAYAIDGDRKYERCPVCTDYFEVDRSLGGSRTDTIYCSQRCNMKAYRGRQQRARELRASGWSLKKIATELGSNTKTVKGWLTK